MKLASTSELVKKYKLHTNKALGQNFIFDENFTDKIVASAGNLDDASVLEIGPGPGSLTRSILKTKIRKLIVVEKDERCLPILTEIQKFYPQNLEIINQDALKIAETELFDCKFKIIANLPYNVGTALIFKWLENIENIISMHTMLQKEVAERIVATTGQKNYCRLSANVNLLCKTRLLFLVNKNVFTPPPKVTSAIVEFIPRNHQELSEISGGLYFHDKFSLKKYQLVVGTAFNQPRKMIRQSLKTLHPCIAEIIDNTGLNATLRAENLSIADFCKISINI